MQFYILFAFRMYKRNNLQALLAGEKGMAFAGAADALQLWTNQCI